MGQEGEEEEEEGEKRQAAESPAPSEEFLIVRYEWQQVTLLVPVLW